jgi:hypothetical protein
MQLLQQLISSAVSQNILKVANVEAIFYRLLR